LAWFTVHQFVGSYGIAFLAPWVVAAAFDVLRLFGKGYPMRVSTLILTGTPYFPVQIFLGLLLGFLIGRHFQHRIMTLVWIIPLISLAYAFVAIPTLTPNITPPRFQAGVGESRLSHYFGWGCQPTSLTHCLDQTLVTLPFYISIAYSLGALLAQKVPERFRRPNPRHFWIYSAAGLFFLAAFCSELRQLVHVQWRWYYLQAIATVAGCGGFLILYSVVVARGKPKSNESEITSA
jgi:hypothetical protein